MENEEQLEYSGPLITARKYAHIVDKDPVETGVFMWNEATGKWVPAPGIADLAAKAALASPTFTDTPVAPTATPGTNTTQVATTAFVQEKRPQREPIFRFDFEEPRE